MKIARILIVDDDQELADSLADVIELSGYDVSVASDGREAVELFRQRHFDLVLTDVRMPIMNGVDCFFEIRRLKPDANVVLMTGLREPIVDRALQAGALHLLYKPFPLSELLFWIERSLANADASRGAGSEHAAPLTGPHTPLVHRSSVGATMPAAAFT